MELRQYGTDNCSGQGGKRMIERLLVPGCTELPACRCGEEMQIASLDRIPKRTDALIRVYKCSACRHEMRLTVWNTEGSA